MQAGTRSLIFIIALLLALTAGVLFCAEMPAKADASAAITSITALDASGNRVAYTDSTKFARGFEITVQGDSAYPNVRIDYYMDTGSGYTALHSSKEYYLPGTAETYSVEAEGALKIAVSLRTALGQDPQYLPERYIRSDNTPPPEPTVDPDGNLALYHNAAFPVGYTLHADAGAGIDYTKSVCVFQNMSGDVLYTEALTADGAAGRYVSVPSNGALTFTLYDTAGNMKAYTYRYTKWYTGDSEYPVVTCTPSTGYTKKVSVTVSWGSQYDNNPAAPKEYAVITAASTLTYQYTGAFDISKEGNVTVRVFYYSGGEKLFMDTHIDNVDITPPQTGSISGTSFQVYCDLTAAIPIWFTVKPVDTVSGIARVYLHNDTELYLISGGYYKGDLMGLTAVTVYAEDGAGNIASAVTAGFQYDYATVAAYAAKYAALNESDFTAEGWSAVQNAFYRLSLAIVSEASDSSQIAERKRAVDTAINGTSNLTVRIVSALPELSGIILFDIPHTALDMKRGTVGKILIDVIRVENETLLKNKESAAALSAFGKKADVYTFSFAIVDANGAAIPIVGSFTVQVALPAGITDAAAYRDLGETVTALSGTVEEDMLTFETDAAGDFYLVVKQAGKTVTVGSKTYPVGTFALWVTLGGVGIIALAVGAVLLLRQRRR